MAVAPKKPERKIHLTDYLWMLKKRSLLILLIWAMVFTAVAVWTFTQEPTYRAWALLQIERTTEAPDVVGGLRMPPSEEFYNSQYMLLRSRKIAHKLYTDMRMYDLDFFKNLPADVDHDAVVQNWIRVTPYPKTHLVEVWIIWQNGQMAADMVNRVTKAYSDAVKANREQAVDRATRVLMDRSQQIETRMKEAQARIQTFSRDREVSVLPEIRSLTLMRERWLQDAASQSHIEMINAQSKYDSLNAAVESGKYSDMLDSETLRDLRLQQYALERARRMEQASVTQQYSRTDSMSRSLQVSMEEVERQMALERARLQRGALTEAAQQLATGQANYEVLNKMLKDNREKLATISQDLLELDGLQKQQMGYEEIRSTLSVALENIKTASQYEEARVQIINDAEVPKQKYSPTPEINLPLGAVVGLLVGVGAAFFLEYLNTTIRMPRDIEDGLGLPVLGFVPAMSPKLRDFPTRALISHLDPSSGPAEAFRGIRTEIMLRSDLRQVRTGLVTSTSPQEGKSTVAVNWAIALAQAGNKVLLVDADLRKPNLHLAFNMTNDRGLSTLLAEKDSATVYIRKTDIENLHVLPGGPVPQNPAELLGSRKMRTLIAEAAERYDSVILDASPVLGVADANILSTMVDCVVLVVQASKNRRALVLRAKNQLASVNARVAGAVLNNVRGSRGDYYYYRQYYRPVAEMMEQEEKL